MSRGKRNWGGSASNRAGDEALELREDGEPETGKRAQEVISLHKFGSDLEVEVTERASAILSEEQVDLGEFIAQHLASCESIGDRHALGGYRMRDTVLAAQILSVQTSLMMVYEYGEFSEKWGTWQPDPAYIALSAKNERERQQREQPRSMLDTYEASGTAEQVAYHWALHRHQLARSNNPNSLPLEPDPRDPGVTAEEVQHIVNDQLHPEHWQLMRWWAGTPEQLRIIVSRRSDS